MKVELTNEMAIDMLKGAFPNYGAMYFFEKLKYGDFNDYRGWNWRYDLYDVLKNESIEKILEYYKMCKLSWND